MLAFPNTRAVQQARIEIEHNCQVYGECRIDRSYGALFEAAQQIASKQPERFHSIYHPETGRYIPQFQDAYTTWKITL